MRYLSLTDTERLDIHMSEVVPAVEEAFRLVGAGKSVVARRTRLMHPPLPEGSSGSGRPWSRDLRIIPGAIEGVGFAARLGASLNHKGGGVFLALWDWETMALKALISDHLVHAIRSTAPDGVLAKYLAAPGASVLGVIGSGRLARWAAEAVCAARPIRQIRVWSPTPDHRAACVSYLQARLNTGVLAAEASSAQDAVREAHIVVTATTSPGPVLDGEWLSPGCTVISNRPEELDRGSIRRGKLVTTFQGDVLTHVPPYQALVELVEAGEIAADTDFPELAHIMAQRTAGRTSSGEIIVALNPAYGVLDVATADYVYRKAIAAGVGVELEP